jgi:hypothetical protein
MTAELQVRLMELSAPGQLVDWVQPFPDLESCWNACTSPEVMLWLAARLCTTAGERRAVVSCLAELTRRAERASQHPDPPVERAASTVETWVRTGAGLDELLAAERAALAAAAWAGIVAAEQGARARRLFRSAPRGRAASFGTGRALGAVADWRQAERARQLALAAAGAARAAADAARASAAPADAGPADAARPGGGTLVFGEPGTPAGSWESGRWEYCVGESAGYAVSALSRARPSRQHDRAARKAAKLIRRRLPCPRLD